MSTTDLIAAIEYETMVFGRHLSGLPGRSRRSKGVLDESAYTLLSLLHVGQPCSIGELSTITGLDVSTLNRQTAALVRSGYAERIADPNGGIARKFVLTDEGLSALKEEQQASRTALAAVVHDWSTEDQETLSSLLRRLNQGIEKRSGRTWPRPQ